MKTSSTNLVRVTGRPISLHRPNPWGVVNEETECIPDGLFSWNVYPLVARCFCYRYGHGFNDIPFTFCLLRFHKIQVIYPKWKVPFVKHTYFLEQACSVISNSFISFFKQTLLPWHVPYIFMTPLLISQAHFVYICDTCLFLKFRNSYVARRNIFLLYRGMASEFIRYNNINICVISFIKGWWHTSW